MPRSKTAVTLLALALTGCAAPAPRDEPTRDLTLQREIEALVAGFAGEVGVHVRHLGNNTFAEVRADESFPTASLVKIPILIGIFAKLDRGELEWSKPLVWDQAKAYDKDDLLAKCTSGAKFELAKLLHLMCSLSDNTASLWLQELAGTGAAINAWLAEHGFATTRVNSRTPGREAEQKRFGWGVTTPREMTELLVAIRQGRVVSAAASERMYRILGRAYWDGEALSEVPLGVHAASKQGAVNASRSEVVLVHAPSGEYAFCLITKNQQDQSWTHDNAGFRMLRDLQRLLWKHYEPARPWRPAPGFETLW